MFECKYKFTLEDSLVSAKYVYKSQKRTQDKVIAILIPILIVAMIIMLVFDILKGRSFVWDIVLIVALVVLEIMHLMIPLMLQSSQKKAYKKHDIENMDYVLIQIQDGLCVETMIKGDQEKMKNVHNLNRLTSYLEDSTRIVLVFNKVEYVCLRKENITGDESKLKAYLQKTMNKTANKKG